MKAAADLRQLEGKRFGVATIGGSTFVLPRLLMRNAGGDPDKVSWVAVGNSAARVQALVTGAIDATITTTSFMPIVARYDRLHLIVDTGPALPDFAYTWEIAGETVIARRRPALQAFVRATAQAIAWAEQNRDQGDRLQPGAAAGCAEGRKSRQRIGSYLERHYWQAAGNRAAGDPERHRVGAGQCRPAMRSRSPMTRSSIPPSPTPPEGPRRARDRRVAQNISATATSGSTVLQDINLTVAAHQFVCLLGASGCGKTTLLRIVAGLTHGHRGDDPDRRQAGLRPRARTAAWCSRITACCRGGRSWAMSSSAWKSAACRAARGGNSAGSTSSRVGLSGFEGHYPHQISGGMQQRVALARAFSKDPKILLMDEPFAAVDMQTREMLQEELLRIWMDNRVTVLFVTHSIDEAIFLGDRVVVMGARPGHVRADVHDRPATAAARAPMRAQSAQFRRAPRCDLRDALRGDAAQWWTDGRRHPASPRRWRPDAGISAAARMRAWLRRGGVVRVASVAVTLAGVGAVRARRRSDLPVLPDGDRGGAAGDAGLRRTAARRKLQPAGPRASGFGAAIVCGVVVGLLMGRYRLIDRLLDVQISALYATPNVALIPLIMLWFGLGMTAKVVIIFLSAFFPIVMNTHSGVRNVGRNLVEIGLAEAASERQIVAKIIIPAALPFIMTGIRLAVGRAVVGMVVAEMFTAVAGLGGAIVTYGNAFATSKLFVVIILLALLGVGLSELARALERHFAAWKETERAS